MRTWRPWQVVSATRAIAEGEELLVSYGERSNDEFFLYYGFVPPRNPHDDVALFASVEDAIDWHLDRYIPPATLPPAALQAAIAAAYGAAAAQEPDPAEAEAALEGLGEGEAAKVRAEAARLKLCSGGRVDGRLLAAFEALHGPARAAGGPVAPGAQAHVRQAVGARAGEVLRSMRRAGGAALLPDLRALAAWEAGTGREPEHGFQQELEHYQAAIAGSAERELAEAAAAAAAAADGGGGGDLGVVADAGGVAGDEALLALLRQAGAAGGGGTGESGLAAGAGEAEEAQQGGGEVATLARMYRAGKMAICWDAVLAAAQDS
jgi:hypothetical protein